MSLSQFAANKIEHKAPFYIANHSDVFTKTGDVRQSDKIRNLVKKHHSDRASGSGVTVYVLRISGPQIPFGPVNYLSYNDHTGIVSFNQK